MLEKELQNRKEKNKCNVPVWLGPATVAAPTRPRPSSVARIRPAVRVGPVSAVVDSPHGPRWPWNAATRSAAWAPPRPYDRGRPRHVRGIRRPPQEPRPGPTPAGRPWFARATWGWGLGTGPGRERRRVGPSKLRRRFCKMNLKASRNLPVTLFIIIIR